MQLLLESLDLPLALGAELFELLQLGNGQHKLVVAILGGLPPTLHLLRQQPLLQAITALFGAIQASIFQNHREFVGSAPALWGLLGCLHLPYL